MRGPKPKPAIDRLMKWVEQLPDAPGCWLYIGTLNPAGYGQIWSRELGRPTQVHRITYQHYKGPIPDGLELDHLCRVRCCCNPEHLEAVPHKINSLRGTSPCADNARKTKCPRGHVFNEQNTRLDPDGFRHCRPCDTINNHNRESYGRPKRSALFAARTHCENGHRYSAANTSVRKNGSRRCKTCHSADERARRISAQGKGPVPAAGCSLGVDETA